MDEHNSVLKLLLISSALILGFFACVCLGELENEASVQALPMDRALLYEEDAVTTYTMDHATGRIAPVHSSVSYSYLDPTGISVQQNVTQRNICSSNTAHCYNEVDNDFNVNPP